MPWAGVKTKLHSADQAVQQKWAVSAGSPGTASTEYFNPAPVLTEQKQTGPTGIFPVFPISQPRPVNDEF